MCEILRYHSMMPASSHSFMMFFASSFTYRSDISLPLCPVERHLFQITTPIIYPHATQMSHKNTNILLPLKFFSCKHGYDFLAHCHSKHPSRLSVEGGIFNTHIKSKVERFYFLDRYLIALSVSFTKTPFTSSFSCALSDFSLSAEDEIAMTSILSEPSCSSLCFLSSSFI